MLGWCFAGSDRWIGFPKSRRVSVQTPLPSPQGEYGGIASSHLNFDGAEAEFAGGDGSFEGIDHDGVELAARQRFDFAERIIEIHRGLIRTIGGHSVKRVRNTDDARHQRNLWALQAVRIAAAVHVLMVQFDTRQHVLEL